MAIQYTKFDKGIRRHLKTLLRQRPPGPNYDSFKQRIGKEVVRETDSEKAPAHRPAGAARKQR